MAFPLLGLVTGAISFWKAKQEMRISFFSAIGNFIATHWRIVLVVLVLAFAWLKLNTLINEAKQWKHLYESLEQTIYTAKAERDDELAAAKAKGKLDVEEATFKHQSDMANIIRKAGHEKSIDTRTINNFRDGLRLAIQRETEIRTGLPGDDSGGLAETDSDTTIAGYEKQITGLNEYIKNLEDGGAVCAADYNFCRDYVTKEQARIGVEKTE